MLQGLFKNRKKGGSKNSRDLDNKAKLFSMASDPVRLRIFCFMFENDEGCVSDVAEAVESSVANVSQHLRLMKMHGLFETEKIGNHVCYKLIRDDFINALEDIIC